MNNGVAVRVYSRVISKKASHMNIQLTRIAHLEQVSTVWDVRLSIVERGTCDRACQYGVSWQTENLVSTFW